MSHGTLLYPLREHNRDITAHGNRMNTRPNVRASRPRRRRRVPAGPDALRTARLTLVPWHDRYAEDFVRLARDERVMRPLGVAPWSRERTLERHHQALRQWRLEGFGLRAILRHGRFAGLVSLTGCAWPTVATPAREIGWWIDPAFWGRGIATEAASAVRDEAFRLGAATLVARCHPANRPSERIMIKIGMTYHGDGHDRHGTPYRVYTLPRPLITPPSPRDQYAGVAARGE